MLIVLPSLAALWLATASTLYQILAIRNPQAALLVWPFGAGAKARLSASMLTGKPSRAQVTAAEQLARAALAREPVNIVAARTLGAVRAMRGDAQTAARMLAYAGSLSRRDFLTEIALIEDEIGRNNIAGALRHYDHALRTTPQGYDLLFPILIGAAEDPQIRRPLAQLLAERPPWWSAFVERLVAESRAPEALVAIMGAIRPKRNDEGELSLVRAAINRLVALGAPGEALVLYQAIRSKSDVLIRNPDFADRSILPPLDWAFTDEVDLRGYVARQPQVGNALYLYAANGRSGDAARQLLVLTPGTYSFSFIAGDVPDTRVGRPRILIACGQSKGGEVILDEPLPTVHGRPSRQTFRFSVPPQNCDFQWLSFRALSGDVDAESWVGDLKLVRN